MENLKFLGTVLLVDAGHLVMGWCVEGLLFSVTKDWWEKAIPGISIEEAVRRKYWEVIYGDWRDPWLASTLEKSATEKEIQLSRTQKAILWTGNLAARGCHAWLWSQITQSCSERKKN